MVNPTGPTTLNATLVSAAPDVRDLTAYTSALSALATAPLCFVLPEGVTLAVPARQVLSWQPQAAEVLGRINRLLAQQGRRLPTRSMATLAELSIPGLQRVDVHMGTAHGDRTGELAWSTEPDRDRLRERAMTMIERWVTDVLDGIVGEGADTAALRQAVRDLWALHAREALFAVQTLPDKVYAWGTHPNGTVRPGSQGSYPALADAVANALHGQTLVPGHGVMRRVIPRHAQGRAELIGEPVRGEQGGLVSVVVNVRVLSLPGLSRPLIALTPYLRCWETAPAPAQHGAVTAYVLDRDAAWPAHAFALSAGTCLQRVSGYLESARAQSRDGDAVLDPCGDRGAWVLIQQRGSDGRLATATVCEHDRAAVLRGGTAPLASLGLVPWTGVREVTPPSSEPEVVLGFTALPLGTSGHTGWAALAFRLCLRSGQVEARAAYSKDSVPSSLGLTPWEPLSQTLTRLAGASPLALNGAERQAQYQSFIAQTVQAELAGGRVPLVTVDSTHAVALWPWLADSRINPEHINFEQLGLRDLQVAWGRAGVRLVRLRQNNAPPVGVGGPLHGTSRLLRVEGTTIFTYLACGPTPGPDPVELSVLLTQPGDAPDQLARFVSGLLIGCGNHSDGPVLPMPKSLEGLMRG